MNNVDNNILTIKDLCFSYNDKQNFTLNDINLDFCTGKIYAILGRNGCGKSTLLNCINNQISNYKGHIYLFNNKKNIKSIKAKERAKIISLVPQHVIQNSLNVYDSILLGRKPHINISPLFTDHQMTSRAISLFGLNHLSLKATAELSGGEAQCVAIARAFAQNTKIMLLDEPTNNLDVKKQYDIFNIIKDEVTKKNLCVICILHDINHAIKYADELIFMKNGKIICKGQSDIVNENLIKKIYGVNAHIFQEDKEKYIIV